MCRLPPMRRLNGNDVVTLHAHMVKIHPPSWLTHHLLSQNVSFFFTTGNSTKGSDRLLRFWKWVGFFIPWLRLLLTSVFLLIFFSLHKLCLHTSYKWRSVCMASPGAEHYACWVALFELHIYISIYKHIYWYRFNMYIQTQWTGSTPTLHTEVLAGTCVLLEWFTYGDSVSIEKRRTSAKSSLKWLLDANNTGSNNIISALYGTTALECVCVFFCAFKGCPSPPPPFPPPGPHPPTVSEHWILTGKAEIWILKQGYLRKRDNILLFSLDWFNLKQPARHLDFFP